MLNVWDISDMYHRNNKNTFTENLHSQNVHFIIQKQNTKTTNNIINSIRVEKNHVGTLSVEI